MLRGLGILLLVACASLSKPAAAQTWAEFRPEGIGYSVEMPGEWKLTTQDVATAVGTIKVYMATVSAGSRAFMTMYSRYPDEYLRGRPVAPVLDGARDGAVANIKGKLRSEEKLLVSDLEARHIIIDTPQGLVVVDRFFLVQSTMVQALVAGPSNIENEADTKRFVGSLKVVPR